MSTLKVNKLRDTAGSTDAITLDPNGGAVLAGVTTVTSVKVGAAVTISESGIEASGIGITCANINGTQIGGRRNLIINGAMNVAQRGTSSTVDGYGCIDRFRSNISGNDEAPTQSQVDVASGTSPYSLGFRKAFRMTNGNQTSGAGTTDVLCILHRMEAQDIANSGWNYTDSNSKITLSFWCKSSVAQVFYGYLRTKDGTEQLYPFQIGSLSADTWTKITKTIPGNSNLQFDNDNAHGLDIEFLMYRGTDRTGSISLDAWGAYNSSIRVPDMTSTWYTTNDATFEITGVQLEVGSQATAFEHRTIGDELTLCHRYFQEFPESVGDKYGTLFNAYVANTGYVQGAFLFPEMRTAPTVTTTGNFRILYRGSTASVSSFQFYHANKTSLNPQALTSTTLTLGEGAMVSADNDASARIQLSAEL